jgi:CheY-like chemotaxis protein
MNATSAPLLIVEDEPHDVEFLTRALQRIGFAHPVHVTSNGEEAVAYLEGSGKFADRGSFPFPRVIITDLKMPQMGGLELLRWLQSQPHTRVVPTVVFTSSTSQADVNAAFQFGASGYMVKPVAFEDLEHMVKAIAEYWKLSLLPTPAE